MAKLIACPQCKGQVSPSAMKCPHCGHPLKAGFLGKPGTLGGALNTGCFILLIAGVLLFVLLLLMGF